MTDVVQKVVVPNPQGLHARPIAMIAAISSRFRASLVVSTDGREVDGRSILQLMTLCAAKGTELTLCASGDDAEELVRAVATAIQEGFGEM